MCGIAGVLGTQASTTWSRGVLRRQSRRGPDDSGVASVESLATLCHTRLSVIDLSHAGHQPMTDPSDRFSITFNGEIFNHLDLRRRAEALEWEFRGSSDTEVLLANWVLFGDNVLKDLNGMFAFCVVDRVGRVAWLVRDRFGVKPLFLRMEPGRLEFASTPDVLAAESGSQAIDMDYLARGLATWGFDSDRPDSPFAGIAALPGGTIMCVDLSRPGAIDVSTRRWYDFASRSALKERDAIPARAGQRIRELLTDAIRLRMRADVPVGLSLSGGLDSSIIASVASQEASMPVHAFFFSLGPDDKEALAVSELARALGPGRLRVQIVGPPSRTRMREVLEDALLCQGAPVAGLSSLAQYQVFAAARNAGITVMLGGQGADEAFMGYRKYQVSVARGLAKDRRYVESGRVAAGFLRTMIFEGRDLRAYLQAARRYQRVQPPVGLARWLPRNQGIGISTDPRELQINDILRLGLPTLLRLEDRNSMAHSVESRHPFMDYRVMEFGASIDVRLNVRGGYGKWILRSAFSSDIPKSIAWARFKRGFAPGDELWLEAGAGAHLRDIIARGRRVIADALSLPDDEVGPENYPDRALAGSAALMCEALALAWVGLTLNRGIV